MEAPRAYATAGAFRRALEARLKRISQTEETDLNRLRRQVSFDRLLARLFRVEPAPWALKGGYALELRFKTARSTVDIDLSLQPVVAVAGQADASRAVREMLQNAASISLGDWFEYTIGLPVMDLEAAPYGGARYPIEAQWTGGCFLDSIWMPESATQSWSHWRPSNAGSGSSSPASKVRGFV